MAGKRDSLVLFLELRMSRRVDGELRKVKNKVKKASRGWAKEIQNVFKRATIFRFSTIAINSFFNSLTFARQEATKFQHAMAQIVKLDMPRFLNLGSDATKKLGMEISRLAGAYNSTREAAATAYKTIVTAGFRGAEASVLFKTALLATASAGLSANSAISLLVSTMKQFNFGVEGTEKALDQLLVIQSNAAIGFSEFAGAFRSGGAALAGMTENLAQAGALIAALAETTRESGSVVGTFFKTVGARIVGRAATRQTFQKLGIDIEVDGRMRPILDLLDDLSDKIADMSDVRKGEVLSVIAGQRQINRLIILLNNLGRVRDLQAEGEKAFGDSRRRAAIEAQTFNAKWNKMQIEFVQRLEDKLIPSLDTFVAAAGKAADFIVWSAEVIENAVTGFMPGLISGRGSQQQTDLFQSRREAVQSQVAKMPEGPARTQIEGFLNEFSKLVAEMKLVTERNFKFEALKNEKGELTGQSVTKFQKEEKARSGILNQQRIFLNHAEKALKRFSAALSAEALKKFTELEQLRSPGATDSTGARLAQSIKDSFLGDVEDRPAAKKQNALALINEQLAQTYEQILRPANSFNDSLVGTRKKLQAMSKIRLEPLEKGLKRAQAQFDLVLKQSKEIDPKTGKPKVRKGTVIVARQNLEDVKQGVLIKRRQEEAKLMEADANALRRLNTRLQDLGDKTREASSQVGSATNRLAKAHLKQAAAADTLRLAERGVGVALATYRVGLMMAQIESSKLGNTMSGMAQELASLDKIGNVIDQEIQLDILRRDALAGQLDLVKQIIDKQEGIGLSFFTSGAGQRNDIFKGFGALSQMFGQFGGDASKFQGLSDEQLNQFGRTLLALPESTRKAMVDALGSLPEGATIAGFGSDQLRSMLSSAALGRGAGVSNVQDLRKRAAEATMELARLNTDELATSMQGLQVANKQLDQSQAQTELQRIRVAQAREHLQVVMRGQAEQRSKLEEQIGYVKEQAAIMRATQVGKGTQPHENIQARAKANAEALEMYLNKHPKARERSGIGKPSDKDKKDRLVELGGGVIDRIPAGDNEIMERAFHEMHETQQKYYEQSLKNQREAAVALQEAMIAGAVQELMPGGEVQISNPSNLNAAEVQEIVDKHSGTRNVTADITVNNKIQIQVDDAIAIGNRMIELIKKEFVGKWKDVAAAMDPAVQEIMAAINEGRSISPAEIDMLLIALRAVKATGSGVDE